MNLLDGCHPSGPPATGLTIGPEPAGTVGRRPENVASTTCPILVHKWERRVCGVLRGPAPWGALPVRRGGSTTPGRARRRRPDRVPALRGACPGSLPHSETPEHPEQKRPYIRTHVCTGPDPVPRAVRALGMVRRRRTL